MTLDDVSVARTFVAGVAPLQDLSDFDAAVRSVAEQNAAYQHECIRLITDGGMHFWSPGDPVPSTGNRLLLGYVTWSGYERLLLKIVNEVLTGPNPPPLRVDVFDMDCCQSMHEFDDYVPGIGIVACAPVVGLWVDGVLREKMACSPSRDIVARACGLDPSYIDGRVEEMAQENLRRYLKLYAEILPHAPH